LRVRPIQGVRPGLRPSQPAFKISCHPKQVGKLFGLGTKEDAETTRQNIARAANAKLDTANAYLAKIEQALAEKGAGVAAGAALAPTGGGQSPSQTAAEYTSGRGPIPGSAQMQSQMYQWLLAHGTQNRPFDFL
jgi:hypothetical protein